MKLLVDTNVFLDLILKREPFFNEDMKFLKICQAKRHEIHITAMSFRDIEYVIRKQLKDIEKVKFILNKVYGLVTKIIPITADDAINTIFDYEKDFEDYLISCSCKSANLDAIVTNNEKDFKHPNVKVFSTKTFNKKCI